MGHLEYNQILSDRQFGFRWNRSTEQATTFFIYQIRTTTDEGNYIQQVLIIMTKHMIPSLIPPSSISSLPMISQELNASG